MKLSGIVHCIYIWTLHLADEIAFSSNNLLQPGPEAAAGHLGGLPGDVAEELLNGGDQGLFFVRGSAALPPLRQLSVEDVENCEG